MIEFSIKDQFGREYTEESWPDSVVVLFGSDKGGSEFNEPWAKAIQDSLKDQEGYEDLRIVAVADLRGVPFFIKPIVKAMFPDEKELWILLDWGGEFAKSYSFEKDRSNILVFDRRSHLRYQTSVAEFDSTALPALLGEIRGALQERPPLSDQTAE